MAKRAFTVFVLSLVLLCQACQNGPKVYYNVTEAIGYAKLKWLVNDVKAARDAEDAARTQFTSSLDPFKSAVNDNGGDLQAMHNNLDSQYVSCKRSAAAVHSKIDLVKENGNLFFTDWTGDIATLKDDPIVQASYQDFYDRTQRSYEEMLARMDKAAASMDLVLARFQTIKSNLNPEAIASLKETEEQLDGEIDHLVKDMNDSITEADQFIANHQGKKG